ncbi:sensor histidine kinase [Chloroflexus sp.]|uniref:sensor histidine kinase n=1 Tax=Chloroflexus sp. TaxID=1904827 RepID=UPI00404B15A0
MSTEPAALLERATAIVTAQLNELRDLYHAALHQHEDIRRRVQQLSRQLDEAVIQERFARERGMSTVAATARVNQIRAEHAAAAATEAELRRAMRQLDQLIRQIEMSSTTLTRNAEGVAADPWVQALRAQIIKGREEERIRLAREVHDGPAQVLANVLMGVEVCQNLLQEQHLDRLGSILSQLGDSVREGLREVRSFIADLRPGKLEEQGLVAALHEYIRRYRDTVSNAVHFEADPLPRLPAEAEIVLYRIVQEALQNARKHARGAPVRVTLTARNGQLQLIIRDEGPGFDLREVSRRAGRESWGLTSMRERAELIGAQLTVTTRHGAGTEVYVKMPLPTAR